MDACIGRIKPVRPEKPDGWVPRGVIVHWHAGGGGNATRMYSADDGRTPYIRGSGVKLDGTQIISVTSDHACCDTSGAGEVASRQISILAYWQT